jgi:hypothetical protein
MVQFVFPRCRVLVDEAARYVESRMEDGTKVGATPNADDWSRRIAAELGYGGDTWSMSRDHELAHTWLAHVEGRPWSPTMWRLAHPDSAEVADDTEVAEEEARVLDFQRSLDKSGPRPWETSEEIVRLPLEW